MEGTTTKDNAVHNMQMEKSPSPRPSDIQNNYSFVVGQHVYFYLSMCDMYIYATVREVLLSGEIVTLEYELDKVLYTRRLEMNTLDNNILLEEVSIAKDYMETKMRRMNNVQEQESIIYFHTTSGTYVKGTVISIQNHDVEFKGYEKSPTKAFYVEVPSEGSLQHKFLMYPFQYKVFKSQHEFESMYKATYQPKLYSSKTIVNLRKTVKMVSSFLCLS